MASDTPAEFIIPLTTEVVLLDCKDAFEALTEQEKLYCHHLSQASFYGGLIVLFQTSPEAPGIFVLLQKLFKAQSPDDIAVTAKSVGFSDEDTQAFFIYAAAFYANMGNYKSFGDTKFVPNVQKEKIKALLTASKAYENEGDQIDKIWESVENGMFSLNPKARELGLGEKGTSTYYSTNCSEKDAKIAQAFMDSKNLSPYNTRLFKARDESSLKIVYEVKLAAALTSVDSVPGFESEILGDYTFLPDCQKEPVTFQITRGDYSPLMSWVVKELESAKSHAANEKEQNMLSEYIKSFKTGSIPAHKDGSRFWIANRGPIVETYIGFIESYRDPFGVRGEFEGFVAVVNKHMSAKFAELVSNAEKFLTHLPWPVEYEKDNFLQPDFTSLDVLSFGGSGIPAGINIPNYDDIRQTEGFKNVALGNVLTSSYKDTKPPTFLFEKDKEVYTKYKIPSFEVQVGLHELLGHGSGKLFMEEKKGQFNFDQKSTFYPETDTPIKSWYAPGETWDSKFSSLASSYEECRAECVGIYLCLLADVLKIFGHTGNKADDIIYVNWLNMVRAGLMALEFYSPDTQSWKQAHMNARFVILRVLLEAGDGLVSVEKVPGDDGKPDVKINLDRSKIIPTGKKAIGDFLRKLQVYKSTADFEAANKMYKEYSDVNDHEPPHFLNLRQIVMDRKQPRKLFVQHHTYLEGKEVKLKSYDASAKGCIQSFVDRFPSADVDEALMKMWDEERHHHLAWNWKGAF